MPNYGGFFFVADRERMCAMRYNKPPLSFPAQAELLLSRGLEADRAELIRRLEQVSYYRLSSYLYPFRQPASNQFAAGTTLDTVWDRYVFDRQLRVCVIDAVERIEVAIKTKLTNELSLRHGPFAHIDRAHLPNIDYDKHRTLMQKLERAEDRSSEPFVSHFRRKYTSETALPLWMVSEIMDYGCMLTLFRGCEASVKQEIARPYGISDRVLESWLVAINTLRNLCAHHGRLWDRRHGTAVMIPRPRNHPQWHDPVAVGSNPNNNFAQFTVLRYLLSYIAPQSAWSRRLESLWTDKHPDVPITKMGFPANWKYCSIWTS